MKTLNNIFMPTIHYRNKVTAKRTKGEHEFGPSQTVPGETLSMGELLKRYAAGQQLTTRNPVYLDQEDVDLINRYYAPGSLDLTDLDALNDHVQKLQQAVQTGIEKAEREEREKSQQTKTTGSGGGVKPPSDVDDHTHTDKEE